MTQWPLALAVPAFTGRSTLAGHASWEPNPAMTRAVVDRFFAGNLPEPGGAAARRQTVRSVGVAYVMADCGTPSQVGRDIAPYVAAVNRFGCVTVYRLTPAVSG